MIWGYFGGPGVTFTLFLFIASAPSFGLLVFIMLFFVKFAQKGVRGARGMVQCCMAGSRSSERRVAMLEGP